MLVPPTEREGALAPVVVLLENRTILLQIRVCFCILHPMVGKVRCPRSEEIGVRVRSPGLGAMRPSTGYCK